jgi:hypothetical protein
MRIRRTVEGFFSFDQVFNPLPITDDWALLSDGTLAVVRALDYRIDYLNPDGAWTSSAKLPYEWQRLTDDDKQRLVDSVKVAQQRNAMTQWVGGMIRWVNLYSRPYPENFKVPEGFVVPPGLPRDWLMPPGVTLPPNYIYACPPGVEPNRTPGRTSVEATGRAEAAAANCIPAPIQVGGGNAPPPPTIRTVNVMAALDLPDYRPPIGTGAVRADMDGNLWIRANPVRPNPGGPVYDIVSRQGELVNRLQTPPGYSIVGFGKGKVVYLSMRDATGIHLARVRLR